MVRHVLITGGSRGIGLSIAHLFARNSYTCTLISRSPTSLSTALSTLPPPPNPSTPHTSIAGDISSPSFWEADRVGAALKARPGVEGGRVDVLVNCAGVGQRGLFARTRVEELKGVVDTNLTGLMIGTRFLVRGRYLQGRARRRDDGQEEGDGFSPVIINVASLLGLKGGHGAVAYAASKAGVLGFTRALAEELGRPGIRVNAIVPGYISTDMTAGMGESDDLLQKIPLGRFGRPEEVADAALFLARNQYAHNCVINLDGGLSAT